MTNAKKYILFLIFLLLITTCIKNDSGQNIFFDVTETLDLNQRCKNTFQEIYYFKNHYLALLKKNIYNFIIINIRISEKLFAYTSDLKIHFKFPAWSHGTSS